MADKEGQLLPGLGSYHMRIPRDVTNHYEFARILSRKKLPQERVKQIVGEAIEVENKFICDELKCQLIGLNKNLMSDYI